MTPASKLKVFWSMAQFSVGFQLKNTAVSLSENQLGRRDDRLTMLAHFPPDHGLPARGSGHFIIRACGSSLNAIRSIAFLAKVLTCSSVCRLSFGRDIHSRIIFRRSSCSGFMLN